MPKEAIVNILEKLLQRFGNDTSDLIDLANKEHHCQGCVCENVESADSGNIKHNKTCIFYSSLVNIFS
jgi:hypothetical protein